MSDVLGPPTRRRTLQHLRRVDTLASELAKFSPDFVDDFLQRMIADAGPHNEIQRDIAELADELRDAILEHRQRQRA